MVGTYPIQVLFANNCESDLSPAESEKFICNDNAWTLSLPK